MALQLQGTTPQGPQYRQCLGAYALPCRAVTIRLLAALKDAQVAALKGATIHVGPHSDTLYAREDEWARVPEIIREFTIAGRDKVVGSPLGGLLYVSLPAGLALGSVAMQVRWAHQCSRCGGAGKDRRVGSWGSGSRRQRQPAAGGTGGCTKLALCNSPLLPALQAGTAITPAAWRQRLASNPAPWGEIGSGKLWLTLPRDVLLAVSDPRVTTSFWDKAGCRRPDLGDCSALRAMVAACVTTRGCARLCSAGHGCAAVAGRQPQGPTPESHHL